MTRLSAGNVTNIGSVNHTVRIAGIMLSILFIVAGFIKIANFELFLVMLSKVGVPTILLKPGVLLAIAIELGCGFSLALGWKARWAALILAVFLIPSTLMFHPFWTASPDHFYNELYHFLKNVALLGGLLLAFNAYTCKE
ncbi:MULTISPECIES: DoxX family protein [unclassified Serratia (in: enterobacteria)]|uniref:DoxX family protein n=1 Tax=unclassified Serratia (in: enterobacteria) TaxID=2647522 RepID=UPI00307603D3